MAATKLSLGAGLIGVIVTAVGIFSEHQQTIIDNTTTIVTAAGQIATALGIIAGLFFHQKVKVEKDDKIASLQEQKTALQTTANKKTFSKKGKK